VKSVSYNAFNTISARVVEVIKVKAKVHETPFVEPGIPDNVPAVLSDSPNSNTQTGTIINASEIDLDEIDAILGDKK